MFFLEVARAQSLREAGQRLSVNKSTVLRRVNQLEERLGAKLFELRGRSLVLTDEGQRALGYVERVEAELHALERDMMGSDHELRGRVALTTTDVLARGLLAKPLATFLRQYPLVRVDVITDGRPLDLRRAEADVALRHGARPTDDELAFRHVCDVAGAIYAAPQYLESRDVPVSLSNLGAQSWVGFARGHAQIAASRRLGELVPESAVLLGCVDLGSQVAAVREGVGLAILPCFVGDLEPGLVRVLGPDQAVKGGLWLAWHREVRRSARAMALVDHLTRELRSHADLFEGRRGQGQRISSGSFVGT